MDKEVKLGCKKCGYPGHFTYEVLSNRFIAIQIEH